MAAKTHRSLPRLFTGPSHEKDKVTTNAANIESPPPCPSSGVAKKTHRDLPRLITASLPDDHEDTTKTPAAYLSSEMAKTREAILDEAAMGFRIREQTSIRTEACSTAKEELNTTDNSSEADQLRRFLVHSLSVDYQSTPSVPLSDSDREHYSELGFWLSCHEYSGFERTNWYEGTGKNCHASKLSKHEDPLQTERQYLGPLFQRHIYRPCHALGIPIDCAIRAVSRFVFAQDKKIKPSSYDILRTLGLEMFARKLKIDADILLPKLVDDRTVRDYIKARIGGLTRKYFSSLTANQISASGAAATGGIPKTVFYSSSMASIHYTLTKRGITYGKRHEHCMTAASPGWSDKIKMVWQRKAKRSKKSKTRRGTKESVKEVIYTPAPPELGK